MLWKHTAPVTLQARLGLAAAFAGAMVLNGLAGSSTILGGVDTAQVSDSFPNLFAPAGVTFAIWGVIYLLVLAFVGYAFGIGRPKKSALSDKVRAKVVHLLTINLVINSAWILAWQFKVMWLSLLLIASLLVTLVMIAETLRTTKLSDREYVLAKLPFSIYFGWVTVATVANATIWLVSIGWSEWGIRDGAWMVAILLVATAIGLVVALRNRDIAYLTVFIWAYAGILLKHLSPEGYNGTYPSTVITLSILLAVMLSAIVQLSREKFAIR